MCIARTAVRAARRCGALRPIVLVRYLTMQIFLIRYGLLAVFAAAMLEADVIPVLAGVIAHLGYVRSGSAILATTTGAFAGDCIWFWIGRYFSGTIQNSKFYRRIGPKAESLVQRLGIWQIPASHIVYGTRVATMIFWGSKSLPAITFGLIDGLGCIVFTAVLFMLGFAFSGSAELIIGRVKRVEILMLVAVVLFGSGLYLVSKILGRQFQRAPASGGTSEGR